MNKLVLSFVAMLVLSVYAVADHHETGATQQNTPTTTEAPTNPPVTDQDHPKPTKKAKKKKMKKTEAPAETTPAGTSN